MKRFIKNILIFVSILILLAMALDAIVTVGLRRSDIRKYAVWNDIYSGSIDADVVALGSSRCWTTYDTYVLDSILGCQSYNLGIDGHPIDMQILRYNTFRRFAKKPRLLILNVDFLSTMHNSADDGYEREQFFPYILDDSLISQIEDVKHISVAERYLPFVRYVGYHQEIVDGFHSLMGWTYADGGMYKGYRGNDWAWHRESLDMDTIVKLEEYLENEILLENFIKEVTNEGVHIVMVKSPVYEPLFEHFVNVEYSDSVFSSIARKYDIPLLDYYHDSLSMDSTMFYNPSHMNKKGSEHFTQKLCNDLIKLQCIN